MGVFRARASLLLLLMAALPSFAGDSVPLDRMVRCVRETLPRRLHLEPRFEAHSGTSAREIVSSGLRRSHPKMASEIDRAMRVIRERITENRPKRDLRTGQARFGTRLGEDFSTHPEFKGLSLPESPALKKTLREVYNRMLDPSAFAEYVGRLMNDAALFALKSGKPELLAELGRGSIPRAALIGVLRQRYAERGVKDVPARSIFDDREFQDSIAQMPYFDAANSGTGHGSDTHLLQMDFVQDVVSRNMNGDWRAFYRYLSTDEGFPFWDVLFDHGGLAMNSPEEFHSYVFPFLHSQ